MLLFSLMILVGYGLQRYVESDREQNLGLIGDRNPNMGVILPIALQPISVLTLTHLTPARAHNVAPSFLGIMQLGSRLLPRLAPDLLLSAIKEAIV